MRRWYFSVGVRRTRIAFGLSWLAIIPVALWILATLYVPVMAPSFTTPESWGVALGITLLLGISLICHAWAHVWAADIAGSDDTHLPATIRLYPFGDAAQIWPAARTPLREILVAVAGPFASLLLAAAAFLIWDRQLHPYFNVSTLLLAGANLGFALANLTPGFPLDGGRLTRAVIWGILDWPARAITAGVWLGRLIAAVLIGWGVILIAQRARFSLELGITTILAGVLLGLALWSQPAWQWDRPLPPRRPKLPGSVARGAIAAVLILGLLAVAFSLVPTNHGLQAPGTAAAVEPMIVMPPEYLHPHAGSFILTTVFPQTPITAGQWVYGRLSPVVEIVPPERVVPPDKTPQELAEEGRQMLQESETLAAIVALRLAGFDVQVSGEAAEVISILPESPARDVLQPGDDIIGLNGEPINMASELAERIRAQNPDTTIDLLVKRDGREMQLTLPLMQPAGPEEGPRLGITVQTVGTDVELPFPVRVEPKRIAGGPSAGLMFTLTIYNLLTPDDLTGGRQIAGTGTINLDGEVGPIGGVKLKVAAAERAGAEYFLVPPQNYADAHSVARRIQVVEVATAEDAIEFLRSLPPAEG